MACSGTQANDGKIFLPPADNLYALELIIVAAKAGGWRCDESGAGFEMLKKLKEQAPGRSPPMPTRSASCSAPASLNAGGVYSPLELSPFIPNPEFNVSGTYDLDEGFFVDLQYMVVPKGHPGDTAVINALVNHALDADVQGKMAEEVWYGPINENAVLSDAGQSEPVHSLARSRQEPRQQGRCRLSGVGPRGLDPALHRGRAC